MVGKELIKFSDNDVKDLPNSYRNSEIEARNAEIHMRTSCNSEILNSFLKLIVDQNNNYNDALKLMTFDSFFLSYLRTQGPEAMEHEVKNLGLFLKADILVFPVHIGLADSEHWGVLLAYPKTKLIRACDPLGLEHREELYMLLGFLEYMSNKNDVPFSRADWTLKGNPTNLPKQECSMDSGFCVCYYVDAFSKGVEANKLELPSSKNLRQAVQSSLRRGHTRDLQEFTWAPSPFQEIDPYLVTNENIWTKSPWLMALDDLNTRNFTKESMGDTMRFFESIGGIRPTLIEMAGIKLDDCDLNFVLSLENEHTKGNVFLTEASEEETPSVFPRYKERQETDDGMTTSGSSSEQEEEGNENSVILTGCQPILPQATEMEIDKENLPSLENLENISPGGKLSLDTEMFCEGSLSIISKNKDPQKMEWSVKINVNEADGEPEKIALKIGVTKPFQAEIRRGQSRQRMKRRRKWIRQPDGSVKRVNVRKLGLTVINDWDYKSQ